MVLDMGGGMGKGHHRDSHEYSRSDHRPSSLDDASDANLLSEMHTGGSARGSEGGSQRRSWVSVSTATMAHDTYDTLARSRCSVTSLRQLVLHVNAVGKIENGDFFAERCEVRRTMQASDLRAEQREITRTLRRIAGKHRRKLCRVRLPH